MNVWGVTGPILPIPVSAIPEDGPLTRAFALRHYDNSLLKIVMLDEFRPIVRRRPAWLPRPHSGGSGPRGRHRGADGGRSHRCRCRRGCRRGRRRRPRRSGRVDSAAGRTPCRWGWDRWSCGGLRVADEDVEDLDGQRAGVRAKGGAECFGHHLLVVGEGVAAELFSDDLLPGFEVAA